MFTASFRVQPEFQVSESRRNPRGRPRTHRASLGTLGRERQRWEEPGPEQLLFDAVNLQPDVAKVGEASEDGVEVDFSSASDVLGRAYRG